MKFHEVQSVTFEGDILVLAADGETFRVPLEQASERLARATDLQRRFHRVSPSGYGIHWPEIDEDLSVDGLIQTARGKTRSSDASVLRETHE